ncbi:hypothetical protein TIFTF001_009252 [Ficus carica]|uniref:Profilin n=1 Tax=Ficus carica TaxID=3494 RepID=A0AA88CYS8_FICCA|nr:hypothetical protein TIFTF001_009252 [Ficus carica]
MSQLQRGRSLVWQIARQSPSCLFLYSIFLFFFFFSIPEPSSLPLQSRHSQKARRKSSPASIGNPLRERERERVQSLKTKMSWQAYVDEHLLCEIDGNRLTAAAILGQDGSVWAQSANFSQFKPEEIVAINKDFEEPGTLAPTGLFLGGTKYMVIQGEPGAVIRGKKGSGGVTVKKTTQALIIGIYDEPMAPGQCNIIVERLGDYLIDQGL